jgi:hypothetical protein
MEGRRVSTARAICAERVPVRSFNRSEDVWRVCQQALFGGTNWPLLAQHRGDLQGTSERAPDGFDALPPQVFGYLFDRRQERAADRVNDRVRVLASL